MKTIDDLSPAAKPFDAFSKELVQRNCGTTLEAGHTVLDCIAAAKRILLQERVRDFTAADVVALAAVIEARDRAYNLTYRGKE